MRLVMLVRGLVIVSSVSCAPPPKVPARVENAPSTNPAAAPVSCEADPSFHDLDFWIGTWSVAEAGKPAGTNRIEKILAGCAVVEHWSDVDGHEGKSLFYHPPGSTIWKQVWITDQATVPGGSKEKALIGRDPNGALRFQGGIPTPHGTVLDRTTLTPLENGDVRQQIEISRDRGATWRTTFDAIYTRSRPISLSPNINLWPLRSRRLSPASVANRGPS